jgi:16S rRNA (adenine1518-N6/adenine1519-N6)-dimethyltransferase
VVVVERDPRFLPALQELAAAAPGRLRIVEADALEVAYEALARAPRAVVANLPYNVGTPLLFGWLKQSEAFRSLTLMFQKEVVDRLVAPPGSKTYGRLSVMAQWRAECRPLFDIAAQAFTPPPNVTSAVVHLVPRAMAADEPPFAMMERVVAAAFGQRRKMLRASLRAVEPVPEPFLAAAGIEPTARAEEIPVDGFRRLAIAFAEKS